MVMLARSHSEGYLTNSCHSSPTKRRQETAKAQHQERHLQHDHCRQVVVNNLYKPFAREPPFRISWLSWMYCSFFGEPIRLIYLSIRQFATMRVHKGRNKQNQTCQDSDDGNPLHFHVWPAFVPWTMYMSMYVYIIIYIYTNTHPHPHTHRHTHTPAHTHTQRPSARSGDGS